MNGFSLIELLIAISMGTVIMLMSLIGIRAVSSSIKAANTVSVQNDMLRRSVLKIWYEAGQGTNNLLGFWPGRDYGGDVIVDRWGIGGLPLIGYTGRSNEEDWNWGTEEVGGWTGIRREPPRANVPNTYPIGVTDPSTGERYQFVIGAMNCYQ